MTRKWVLALIGLIAVALGVAVYLRALGQSEGIVGSGTVEARNIRVGSKVGGRVQQVLVREGDRVQAGQVLVTFDDQELLASLEQARGRVAQARLNQAEAARRRMERGYRPEEVAAARAELAQAEGQLREAEARYCERQG